MMDPKIKDKAIIVPEDPVEFARKLFLEIGRTAIEETGMFTVALSGGSTPKALYNKLKGDADAIDWSRVFVFFSDERTVSATNPDSNYHMAMTNGFKELPVPEDQIFRMKGEVDAKKGALEYESKVRERVRNESFDLILLGMGDDGHTASLFPGTKALTEIKRLVVDNVVPQKDTTRITFTYPLLRKAKNVMFLAVGASKAEMVKKVLNDKEHLYPAGEVTSDHSKVLWILDKGSSKNLE
jgi:6-phosphogluconolactonase